MEYSQVWISSPEHLRLFDAITGNASFMERLRRDYPVFEGFTYHRRDNNKREPISFFGIGAIILSPESMMFEGVNSSPWLEREWDSVHLDLSFVLPWSLVATIHPFSHHHMVGRFASSTWVHLHTACDTDWMQDMLLCVGGLNPHPAGYGAQQELLESIRSARRQSAWHAAHAMQHA